MNLPLLPGVLLRCNYADYQELYLDMFSKGVAIFPDGIKGVLVQDTTPTPDQQVGYIWVRTVAGVPDGHEYVFNNGVWRSRHHDIPGTVVGTTDLAVDIPTRDGGSNVAITDTTGPFWQVIASAQFLVGSGTLPSGKILNVGDAGGEENHTTLLTETPAHAHKVQFIGNVCSVTATTRLGGQPTGLPPDFTNTDCPVTDSKGGDASGNTTPHNTMPPYYVINWIVRTARVWYIAP